MDDTNDDVSTILAGSVRQSLHRFLDVYEPLRSELYRYCRYLASNPWDAEDVAQDTMARAFVTLGRMGHAPANPKAWLFRVASNLWIDQTRRARSAQDAHAQSDIGADGRFEADPRHTREAAGTLIAVLSPQERAALVLKHAFDFQVEEIAQTLSTSVGAITAALHRARTKLIEREVNAPTAATSAPVPAVLDAFCEAFNARDLTRLTALLLDSATVEVVGATTEYASDPGDKHILRGMLFGTERLARAETLGGIEGRYVQGALPDSPRAEVRSFEGEPVILLWYKHRDGEAVRAINRIGVNDGGIAALRNYFFTPDLLAEVCTELGVAFRANGYRFWLTGACSGVQS
jgi:RNA polymerase sigma-70 factor (ECF subfamily)